MRTGILNTGGGVLQTGWVTSQGQGSVLVFPFFISDTNDLSHTNTIFTLRNNHPTTSQTFNMYFVNSDGTIVRYGDSLAANATKIVNVADYSANVSGYVLFVARASNGFPSNFNYFSGSASVIMASGHSLTYSGCSIKALSLVWPPLSNLKSSNPRIELPFDGMFFEFLPGPTADGNNNLTLTGIDSNSIIALSGVNGDLSGEGLQSFFGVKGTLVAGGKNIVVDMTSESSLLFYGTLSELFPSITDMNSILTNGNGIFSAKPIGSRSLFGLVLQKNAIVSRNIDITTSPTYSSLLGVSVI